MLSETSYTRQHPDNPSVFMQRCHPSGYYKVFNIDGLSDTQAVFDCFDDAQSYFEGLAGTPRRTVLSARLVRFRWCESPAKAAWYYYDFETYKEACDFWQRLPKTVVTDYAPSRPTKRVGLLKCVTVEPRGL
mgnify:CR=1 FL=1